MLKNSHLYTFILIFAVHYSFAQTKNTSDSTLQLEEVIVRGFENERKISETAASVAYISSRDIQRFENTTLVPIMNTLPGIRMEERSPGSYRLAIRGSSLRSPFGVRNVKVYWNDIPLTDGNGNTFLNALDLNSIGSIEVLKGPSGSIYGAGTGGVLLLGANRAKVQNNNLREHNSFKLGLAFGSFGLQNRQLTWNVATEKVNATLSYTHSQLDGYRQNSSMQKDVLNWRASYFVSPLRTINISTLYSDLHYQTPGGLNQAQFEKDPSLARQATPTLRSALQQKAGIYQKLFNLGVSQEYKINKRWSSVTAIYGTISNLRNPFITNYEIRDEQTFGGRTRMNYDFSLGQFKSRWITGLEWQKSAWVIRNFGNNLGKIDTLQSNDNVAAWTYFAFTQVETELPQNFILTIGGSYNRFKYDFVRLSDAPKIKEISSLLPAAFLPRIALLKKIDNLSIFASIGSGFSPPTVSEYISGYQGINFVPTLVPEKGQNYEVGIRGNLLRKKLNFDLTAYSFHLKNTIVRRTDDAGREIFTNQGRTLQKGLEVALNYNIISDDKSFVQELRAFSAYTLADYKFVDYLQLKNDYSGNKLTGVPPHTFILGLDVRSKIGIYINSTFNFTDKIPLNDANSIDAKSYRLLIGKIGYRKTFKKIAIDMYVLGDNLLDETYSLGNDINALGNRFFNAAPPRNWQTGLSIQLGL